MRLVAALTATSLTLMSCTATVTNNSAPSGAVTPVTWKTDISREVRNADRNDCETLGLGLPPGAAFEEIQAAAAIISPEQRKSVTQRCLRNKGYTISDQPVCSSQQVARGQLVTQADFLPPLSQVRCFVVDQGFVV